MKKIKNKKYLLLLPVVLLAAVLAGILLLGQSAGTSIAESPIKETGEKYAGYTVLEYNGRLYRYFDEAKFYDFITDEKIFEKKDDMFPESYYTLKKDDNGDFLYVGVFRDSRLYTALEMQNSKDVTKGEPTSIILCRTGHKSETAQISNDPSAVREAAELKSLEKSTENLQTFKSADHSGWYEICVCYNNLPVASHSTRITVVERSGEYILLCSTTDTSYSGIVIGDGVIKDLIEGISGKQNQG